MRSTVTLLLWTLTFVVSSSAQESVCLKTGFCLEAASHMISEGMLVVQSGNGTLQFPVDQVDGITALPTVSAGLGGTLTPPRSTASSVDILIRAALLEGLEPEFVRSVAIVESGLRPEAVSPKGALGLMQLMPFTADKLGVNPRRVEENALGGAALLRQLLIKYNGNSAFALAAYNAGSGAVDKYKGVPPYPETRRYVTKVLEEYARQQRIQTEKRLQADRDLRANSSQAAVTVSVQTEALRAETSKPGLDPAPVQP